MKHGDSNSVGKQWDACPAGTLRHLSRRLRVAKRNRLLGRSGAALAVIVLMAAGVWAMLPADWPFSSQHDITCSEVQAALHLYAAGRLPVSTSEQITAHLRVCPACAAKWRQMQAGSLGDTNNVSFPTQVAGRGQLPSVALPCSHAGACYGSEPTVLKQSRWHAKLAAWEVTQAVVGGSRCEPIGPGS